MKEVGATMYVVNKDAKAVKVDATTYKVFISAHTQILMNDQVVEEENFDDSKEVSYKAAPMYVKYDAATEKWALIGNQKKSEFWVNMGFYDTGVGSIEKRFWADVTSITSIQAKPIHTIIQVTSSMMLLFLMIYATQEMFTFMLTMQTAQQTV